MALFAEDERFFLTGGSALGMFYLDHRRSYDLDLFTSEEVDGMQLKNEVLRLAKDIGADCEPVMTSFLLDSVRLNETPEYMIDALDMAEFRAFVDRLRCALAERALPEEG